MKIPTTLRVLERGEHKRVLGGLDILKYIGPGLLVTVGFIDPGNWAANLAAAKTRQGYRVIRRKTAKKRLRRVMKSLWQWCRDHRHENLMEQYKTLCSKLLGHYQY